MTNADTTINDLRYSKNVGELDCVFQLYVRMARLDLDRVKKFYDSRRAALCAPVTDQIISFPAGRPASGTRRPHERR